MSKVTPVAILTSIINLTPISFFCICSVIVYIKDLTIIWQISCWKHTAYCNQKWLKSWTKNILTHVSNKDPESANFLWFALISDCTLRNILKLNQPIKELLHTIYCPKSEIKKLLWLDEEDSVVGSRSDPDDKIATDLCSQSTTENRIATRVISATGPRLLCA